MLPQVSRAPLRQQPIQMTPQSLANIRLQKLPFFEVVAEVIKPTILCGIESRSQFAASSGMMEVLFKLVMEPAHINYITENLDVSNGKAEFLYQAQIRISLMKEGSTEITDFMPLGIHIQIGNKNCPLPPTPPSTEPGTVRQTVRPINCTQLLMLNLCVTQTISINWCPNGLTYIFGMYSRYHL